MDWGYLMKLALIVLAVLVVMAFCIGAIVLGYQRSRDKHKDTPDVHNHLPR